MKSKIEKSIVVGILVASSYAEVFGQGSFQNLDFENGSFTPILGDPFGSVVWSSAMPAWTGYVGTNQVDRLLYNNQFLSLAGIAIWGPDNPEGGTFNGHYHVLLQRGVDPFGSFDVTRVVNPSISQTGTLPPDTQSIRFYSSAIFALGIGVYFDGNQISMSNLGTAANGSQIWGGDMSQYAGHTGALSFQGNGYFDYIQFSPQAIPEPGVFSLFGLGALFLGWRLSRRARS